MGSSKTVQETKIPEYLEEAGRIAVQQAQQAQQMGYIPYMGPELAAINPYEQALAQNVGSMASAFGMAAPAGLDMGMPTVTQGGMTGYSSYPIYQSALERLREQRPEQYQFFAGQTGFDPITGAATGFAQPTADISTIMGGTAGGAAGSTAGGAMDDTVAVNSSRDSGPVDIRAEQRAFFEKVGNQEALDRMDRAEGRGASTAGSFDPFGPRSTSTYTNTITGRETGPLGTFIGRAIF